MHHKFMQIPITQPKATWDRDAIFQTPITETSEPLLDLSWLPEKMVVSPQYFIQQLPGSVPTLVARQTVQSKLVEAAKLLPDGYKFVVFDTWRSITTQQALFDQMVRFVERDNPDFTPEEVQASALRIVALPSQNPTAPSPHNTGGSVDLSIVDENGVLLEMGSPFDDITETAQTTFYEQADDALTATGRTARDNRRLLYHIMTEVGFTNYVEEWWHFDFGNQNWAWASDQPSAQYGATAPNYPWQD